MSNLYKDRELGQAAEQVLAAEVWQQAWDAYRARILEEIEAARSSDAETVMHLKRLLTAASAARSHLERLMKEGAVAAREIDIAEQRSKLRRIFG
jgi:hypothetical protein